MTAVVRDRVAWIIAAVLCAGLWAAAAWRAHVDPAPPRELTFALPDGRRAEHGASCSGPAFADGDVVWQYCSSREGTEFTDYLARIEPARGAAKLVAPLDGLYGMAKSEAGDLAVMATDGQVLVLAGGAIRRLPVAEEQRSWAPIGLGWVGGDVEIVTILANRILRSGAAVMPEHDDPSPKDVELLTFDEAGTVLERQTVRVEGYTILTTLDGAPGNLSVRLGARAT